MIDVLKIFEGRYLRLFPLFLFVGSLHLFYLSKIDQYQLLTFGLISVIFLAFLEITGNLAIQQKMIYWKEREKLIKSEMSSKFSFAIFILIISWIISYIYVICLLFVSRDMFAIIDSSILTMAIIYLLFKLLFFEKLYPLNVKRDEYE
ncbi:MAG: hypothetical protein QXG39_09870 [Candidatus Aenigmatarchaeota archaeon]